MKPRLFNDKSRVFKEIKSFLILTAFLCGMYLWFLSGYLAPVNTALMIVTLGTWPGLFAALISYGAGILILRYFSFFTGNLTGMLLLSSFLLFEGFFFRPFMAAALTLFPLFFCAAISGILLFSLLKKGNALLRIIRSLILLFWFMPPVVGASISVVYNGTHDCPRVKSQSNIRFLIDFCSPQWKKEIAKRAGISMKSQNLEPQARSIFISSDKKLVYVGTGTEDIKGNRLLLAIDRQSRKILKVFKMATPWTGVCHEGKCAITVTPEKSIYLLDEKRMVFTKQFRVPFRTKWIAFDETKEKVFVPGSLAEGLAVLNLRNSSISVYTFKTPPRSTYLYTPALEVAYNPQIGNLYMAPEKYLDIPCLHVFQFSDSDSAPRFFRSCFSFLDAALSLGLPFGLEVDAQQKEVYMAFPLEGSIYVLSETTFEKIRKIKMAVGLRELAFDSRRKLLYAANYLDGYIYAIVPSTGDIRQKIFVGRRIREIRYEPSVDRLFVTSSNGFLEVQLRGKANQNESPEKRFGL